MNRKNKSFFYYLRKTLRFLRRLLVRLALLALVFYMLFGLFSFLNMKMPALPLHLFPSKLTKEQPKPTSGIVTTTPDSITAMPTSATATPAPITAMPTSTTVTPTSTTVTPAPTKTPTPTKTPVSTTMPASVTVKPASTTTIVPTVTLAPTKIPASPTKIPVSPTNTPEKKEVGIQRVTPSPTPNTIQEFNDTTRLELSEEIISKVLTEHNYQVAQKDISIRLNENELYFSSSQKTLIELSIPTTVLKQLQQNSITRINLQDLAIVATEQLLDCTTEYDVARISLIWKRKDLKSPYHFGITIDQDLISLLFHGKYSYDFVN